MDLLCKRKTGPILKIAGVTDEMTGVIGEEIVRIKGEVIAMAWIEAKRTAEVVGARISTTLNIFGAAIVSISKGSAGAIT